MAEMDLLNVFNDCVDRLATGQSVEDCLRLYPQYAARLRPMLETGQVVRRSRISLQEASQAQARVRARVAQAVQALPQRRSYPIQRLATLAASLLILLFITVGGSLALAQSSLPGDSLYGVKRLTENVQLLLNPEDTALPQQFDTRRVTEIQQLIALKRAADVEFKGQIETISGTTWTIAGLAVQVQTASSAAPGDLVAVTGSTTGTGELIANQIQTIQPQQPEPLPTITPVPTRAVTATPLPTATASPTLSPTPTLTPTVTATVTVTSAPTRTLSPTPSPTTILTATATMCVPQPPAGWERYTIAAGDTLSALAAGRGISAAEVTRVNCLTDARLIIAGQPLYLPPGPPPLRPTLAPTQPLAPANTATMPDNSGSSDHAGEDNEGTSDHSGNNNGGSNNSGSNDNSDDQEEDDHSENDNDNN